MFEKLTQKQKSSSISFELDNSVERIIIFRSNYKSSILLEESEYLSFCINCKEKYCYQYSKDEVNSTILEGLPYNNDLRVCPANAIVLKDDNSLEISSDCFSCGLCVNRCPVGGIRLEKKNDYKAEFYSDKLPFFNEIDYKPRVLDFIKKVELIDLPIEPIESNHLDRVYRLIQAHSKGIQDFDLVLARNLFFELGIDNKVSAKGNNDNRFDFLGSINGKYLVGEIDFKGNDFLSLNRRILENITVLNNRYKKQIEKEILPILIILSFPNKRSDYYEVSRDIYNVLGIRIYTLPLHLLFLFFWNGIQLDEAIIENFYVDIDNMSLEKRIKDLIVNIEDIDPFFGNSFYKYLK